MISTAQAVSPWLSVVHPSPEFGTWKVNVTRESLFESATGSLTFVIDEAEMAEASAP
jgi:hypothetical protein